MMSTGARKGVSCGAEQNEEDDDDDDEVYQYPKAGLGPAFASIESILRCAICGGLSDPPVSLPCCQQTFCSLCIRQYLDSTTPRCPCCRSESASNRLQVSKELRSICSIWKRNRRAILTSANASAEAAATGGVVAGRDPSPPGRRKVCEVGAGQGRCGGGGAIQVVHYHSLTEAKLKKHLSEVGLPTGGGKTAMVARHKRLALLSAASNDLEVPIPRRELIKQVAAWEREKEREKQAHAKAAQSSTGGFLPGRAAAGSGAARQTARSTEERAADGSPPPEAEKVVIPKKMAEGFSALIANARKNAKKRPSTCTSSDGGSSSKKVRVSQESGCSSGSYGVGGSCVVGDGGTVTNDGRGNAGFCRTGSDASAVVDNEVSRDDSRGDAAEILGVAGRLIRTRGPWRCFFSPPPASVGKSRNNGSAAYASPEAATEVVRSTKGLVNDKMGGVLPEPEAISINVGDGGSSNSKGCPDAAAQVSGRSEGGARELSLSVVEVNGHSGDAGGAESGDGDRVDGELWKSRGGNEMDAGPAEALKEEGLVYFNTATMETVREPPAELLSLAEEAKIAGEYLIFVPYRSFVAATSSLVTPSALLPSSDSSIHNVSINSAVTAAVTVLGMSGAGSAAEPAAENVLQLPIGETHSCSAREMAAVEAGGEGDEAATVFKREQERRDTQQSQSPLEASMPTPSTAMNPEPFPDGYSKSDRRVSDSGGGGETWDRFSSLPTIDLSQGMPSAPLDVENIGIQDGGGGDDGVVMAAGGGLSSTWACAACTLLNKPRRMTCQVCGTSRPKASLQRAGQPPPSSLLSSAVDSGGGGGGGGGGVGANRRRVGSSSKLRLRRPPQSTIASFTGLPELETGDSGGGKGDGSSDFMVSAGLTSAPSASSGSSHSPLSQRSSLPAAVAPTNGFPAVRFQEYSSLPGNAASAHEKAQQ